jgi:predicted site-specific integrase-resolvase
LSYPTIRSLGDTQTIQCFKTPNGGHRRFNRSDLEKFINPIIVVKEIPEIKKIKDNFIYCRVSSKKQVDDLHRQIEFVKEYKSGIYSNYTSLSDVGSGINFKRKGVETILESCLQGTIGEIVVAHRDRLSRFGFDLFKLIVSKAGGHITVLDDERDKSSEQELAEDLLSIVHIFSCRQMGRRKYKKTNQGENNNEQTIT